MITPQRKQFLEQNIIEALKSVKGCSGYEVVEDGEEFVIHCNDCAVLSDHHFLDAVKMADGLLIHFEEKEIVLMLGDNDD